MLLKKEYFRTAVSKYPIVKKCKKVKWSRYRPGVAQRVGRVIALLFHDRGTITGWMVSSMPRLYFTPGKDPVPISQEAGWAPGPVWTGGKSRPHRDSIPDRPARSQSLYRLSYPPHITYIIPTLVSWLKTRLQFPCTATGVTHIKTLNSCTADGSREVFVKNDALLHLGVNLGIEAFSWCSC